MSNISIFTTKQGHTSLSNAISSALRKNGDQTFTNKYIGKVFLLYDSMYLYFPKLGKIPYRLGNQKSLQKAANFYAKKAYQRPIKADIEFQHPSVIISVWCLLNPLLAQHAKLLNIPFISYLTNPRSIHPVELHPEAYNLAFDHKAVTECIRLGIPKSKIVETGWFVQEKFQKPYKISQIRHQLNLDTNTLTFLIVAGSEGTFDTLRILPSFRKVNKPLQLIISCGNNKKLFSTVKATSKLLCELNPNLNIQVLSFTEDIHLYIQAADLVIGKAGPNLLFETVATHTPFCATTHITGQEDGNLEIIEEYNLGFVAEKIPEFTSLLEKIVANPKHLSKFQPSLKKVAQKNAQAPQKLQKLIRDLKETPPPVKPKISIIIPCLNEERYLPKLLSDLKKQSFTDFETIVVDGQSTDSTIKQITQFSSLSPQVISTSTQNASHQRNLGAKKAKGQWLIFFDADIRINPSFLSKTISYLDKNPVDCFTYFIEPDSESKADHLICSTTNVGLVVSNVLKHPLGVGAGLGLKKTVFDKVKGFDEDLQLSEDHQLIKKIITNGYTFHTFTSPKIAISFRRFRKEGTLNLLRKYAKIHLNTIINYPKIVPEDDYPMLGGKYYHPSAISSKAISQNFSAQFGQLTKAQQQKLIKLIRAWQHKMFN